MLMYWLFAAGVASVIAVSVLDARRARPVASLRRKYDRGTSLSQKGDLQEAIAAFDEVIEHGRDTTGDAFALLVANSMLQKALALCDLGGVDEPVAICQEIDQRFGRARNLGLQLAESRALLLRAQTLKVANRPDAGAVSPAELLDEIEDRFGSSRDGPILAIVAQARVAKAGLLAERGRVEEALAILDQVMSSATRGLGAQADVIAASVLAQKGTLLESKGNLAEALVAYGSLRVRASRMGAPRIEAGALVGEGRVLQALGRHGEALTMCDEAIAFGSPSHPIPRVYLVEATKHRADALWALGRRPEAISAVDDLIRSARDWDDQALVAEMSTARQRIASLAGSSADGQPTP
jgi:tetratricopeptide (TPR) repeat protein